DRFPARVGSPSGLGFAHHAISREQNRSIAHDSTERSRWHRGDVFVSKAAPIRADRSRRECTSLKRNDATHFQSKTAKPRRRKAAGRRGIDVCLFFNASAHSQVPMKAKVLIVDDHPIVRQGLVQLVNQQADLMVCCESEEPAKAFEAIATVRPDILVVDISLKSGSGLELIKNVKATYPHLPALVLSMHDELLYAERALRAGARGYIMKQEAIDKVLVAIRRVL